MKLRLLTTTLFAALFTACTTHGAEHVITLRILDYNIRNCNGMDGSHDINRTAALIKAQRPDVVALQEVDNGAKRTGKIDLAKRLGELTGMAAAFGKAMDFQGGAYGDAVLSRYPIRKIVVHSLPASKGHEPREMMETHIAIGENGPVIVFYNTHLDDKSVTERIAQVKAINEIPKSIDAPFQFLAGDFNAEPDSVPLRELQKFWRDAGPAAKFLTFPAGKPSRRIDYVFYRPDPRIRILDAKVLDEPLISDHRPLLVTVEIKVGNP
jgi:endonuclease/exonuclease/phosphatase family metal-dependent hydrolase